MNRKGKSYNNTLIILLLCGAIGVIILYPLRLFENNTQGEHSATSTSNEVSNEQYKIGETSISPPYDKAYSKS